MDGTRFDRFTRALTIAGTRRGAITAAVAVLVGGPVGDAGARVCRKAGTGCSRGVQCCSGFCDTRRNASRSVRNRCGCTGGAARCNGTCCTPGQSCVGGACVDPCATVEGHCYAARSGSTLTPNNAECVVIDDSKSCAIDGDCPCSGGGTCACVVTGSDNGYVSDRWENGACATITPRAALENACCPTEDWCDVYYGAMACVEVESDDRSNCGACGQICQSPRVCEGGSCNCNEDWCSHFCSSDAAEWLCAELQDGTIIEACSDGYTAKNMLACTSDADCVGQEPGGPTIGGGCIKKAFIAHAPASYSSLSNGGFCAWFTVYGASTCA